MADRSVVVRSFLCRPTAWLALCALVVAGAQSTPPAEQPASSPALIPHLDPTFGFELHVPAGWAYDRARFEQPDGAIGVLRGRDAAGEQALQVLVFRDFEAPDFAGWLDGFVRRLVQMYGANQVTEKRWLNQPRPRATLLADTNVSGRRTQTYYLCVPFDANTIWVLAFAGLASSSADEQRLQAEFDQIAASLRVLYDPLEAEKVATAFERGLTVTQKLHADAAGIRVDEEERFYEILLGGKPVGYLSRRIWLEPRSAGDGARRQSGKPGLRVREESWRFAEDGTVRHTELNMFSSRDLTTELIEHCTTQVPAPDVPSQRLYIELDQCVREGRTLFSSFSTNLDLDLRDPRPPIPIGPRYLDLAWVRLLPRLLLDAPQETYAFASYDCLTRALMIYLIRPLGPCEIPGTPGQLGHAFETREGFVVAPSRLYVDASGQMVRLESGDLVLTQVTPEEIERNYAQRREPARLRMQPPASRPTRPG